MNTTKELPLVGIVVVSHSDLIARGTADLAAEMGGDVAVIPAGGASDGGLGTDVERVMRSIEQAESGAGVVVLADLGSAVLSTDTAIELLGPGWAGRVMVADGPVVEGTVAAAVRAQTGGDLSEVAAAASTRSSSAGFSSDGQDGGAGEAAASITPEYVRTTTLVNPDGLHARPAAEFVKLATALGTRVTVNGKDARSLLGILSLGLAQGATVEIATEDREGANAVDRLVALVESGFSGGA